VSPPDLSSALAAEMPELRGRLSKNVALADITWFRVGGPAEVLFMPADEADLAYFLACLPASIPIFVLGLGSNLLVRDGGVPGVVIRLGRGFAHTRSEPEHRLRAGAAVPDVKLARAAADARSCRLTAARSHRRERPDDFRQATSARSETILRKRAARRRPPLRDRNMAVRRAS